MPVVIAEARQLAVGQSISQDESSVFQSGSDNYGNQRAKIEIDQPLIDLTVKHKVAEAEAKRRLHKSIFDSKENEATRQFVTTFSNAVRFAHLVNSFDRVIARLDRELVNASKNFELQMATVEDIENIKSALVAMRQEKLLYEQQHDRSLAELGLSRSATSNIRIASSQKLRLTSPKDIVLLADPEVSMLQAEIDVLASKAAATRSADLPRLSLYGLAQYDDAGGSEFGSGRTLNGYEAGIVLRWNIWDGGVNRSEAKKIEYLKLAKQAELNAQLSRATRDTDLADQGLQLSQSNLQSLDKLVEHHANILEAVEASYEAGEESYVKMVNTFLIYESQVRQQVHGRFDYINKQTELYTLHNGWSQNLINDLDRIFTSSR